ncbi:MAG TPA: sulfatase-like hydrolase/transferase [Desulfomonilia bacterium]|nr:sulfatase-like hydrolase/transferase [Desulfomonilia bacterium]
MTGKYSLRTVTQTTYFRAVTALMAATLAVLIDPILRFSDYRVLLHVLPVAGTVKFAGTLTLVFLQVVALFYLILLLPRSLRTVALLLSVFVVVIQFSYWLTLSQFMTSTDLFLVLTVGMNHRAEAVSSFFHPLVFLYALPYALVLSALILVPPVSGFRKTLALSLLPALYLLASNYVLFLHVPERSFHLNPLTSFLRSTLHYEFENLREYHGPRDDLPPFHVSQRPLDSIIYVIDESVRGSNLSLNGYPRATTPFLQTLETQGRLKNLGICVGASSFSYISNAYLITGHNAFPDDTFRTVRNPTIFDYAKKMGYETIYIDIDQGYLSLLVKAAGDGPVRSLDRYMTDQSFEERHVDLEITKDLGVARFLSSLLNERSGYFVLVNKKGLHFHYRNRYPNDMASTIWSPVMEASDPIDPSATGREKLVNTYDNGIRFQVDEFFRVFVSETTNQNYVILYTSDHGQTLAEHGQVYTHMKPDKVIVDVPDFLVSGERYGKKGLLAEILPGIRVSHLNNFATLLDLMGVPMSLRVRPYDKSIFSLTDEDNSVRYFMSGSLHGSGDYVVKMIPTPPDEGWGVSRPVGYGPKSE